MDVIPGASVPLIIVTPLNFNPPVPVKLTLFPVVHALLACLHKNSLSPSEDLTIIPAESTCVSLSNVLSEPNPSSIFLSSTLNVAESIE
jgi:hypothetical protein